MTSTKVQWRLEIRKTRHHAWHKRGLYETRERAREEAAFIRRSEVGFGNTRVVRYVKGQK